MIVGQTFLKLYWTYVFEVESKVSFYFRVSPVIGEQFDPLLHKHMLHMHDM